MGAVGTKQEELRRERRAPTPAERALWACVRDRQLGVKFRNHHVILGFIVDLYCPALRLAIEVDGSVHAEQRVYDEDRTLLLRQQGVTVLRVCNEDVLERIHHVIAQIHEAIHRVRLERTAL